MKFKITGEICKMRSAISGYSNVVTYLSVICLSDRPYQGHQ